MAGCIDASSLLSVDEQALLRPPMAGCIDASSLLSAPAPRSSFIGFQGRSAGDSWKVCFFPG
jgi:hypothetical protein